MAWTSGEWSSAAPSPTRLVPPEPVCLAIHALGLREGRKAVSQRKLVSEVVLPLRKGGVKRLVVSTSSAMSVAWVSVSYYTNAKLVKKDLCIASNYFCFFPLALLSYLTHTKTICKELEECPSHNSPLCGEVTAVLVIQLNETAEHDSSSIKNMFFKKRKKRCRTLYFSWVTVCL